MMNNTDTQLIKFGLIGKGIGYSMSKSLHERLFALSHVSAQYDILDIDDIEDNIEYIKANYSGFNVTKPYKVDIIDYLDEVDERARVIGSVNTVVNENGRLIGYNTDLDGIVETFHLDRVSVENKNCLIIGYGGVCKTLIYAMNMMGANKINIAGRNSAKIGNLIDEMRNIGIEIGMDQNVSNKYDIVINATSLGTDPQHKTPIDVSLIRDIEYYFDLVYNPRCTRLALECAENGTKTRDGLYMLVMQAVKAQQYYLGSTFSKKDVFDVFRRLAGEIFRKQHKIQEKCNISLVGFMGSGKSTIGKRLAEILDAEYVDTDDIIKSRYGSISNIFKEHGEDYFRSIESEVLRETMSRNNVIVSTGGGIVMREENRRILRESKSLVIYLDSTFDKVSERVAGSDRPLFRDKDKARALYGMRAPLYSETADIVVNGDLDVDETIDEILIK